jgi:hypothetical protein
MLWLCKNARTVTLAAVAQYRKLESRPIFVMAKKRLRRVVQEWQAAVHAKEAARRQVAAVQLQANHKVMRRALLSW